MSQRAEDAAAVAARTEGMLYLTAARSDTLRDVMGLFTAAGLAVDEPHPEILRVSMACGKLAQLSDELSRRLTSHDLRGVRCCILQHNTLPTLSDLMQTESLEALLDRVQAEWLVEVLRTSRLTTYFQPIVRCECPADIMAYECLLRGKQTDGSIIPPDRLYRAARSSGLLYHLDRVARLTHIKTAANCRLSSDVFINFNPSSVYDPVHCLQSTIQAINETGMSPRRFVFEVVESEEIRDPNRLLKILDYYRDAGLRVALDDLGAGYSSLNLLAKLKPDFIKLDMDLTRNVDGDPYKSQVAGKILEMARELQIATVVEGVETVGEWQWAVEHGADFAQGYLFARPEPWPELPKATTRVPSGSSPGLPVGIPEVGALAAR